MKLKQQFDDFYKEIKLDSEVEDLKEKREILQSDIENKLPGEFEKHDIKLNKSDIEMFDQGSYKLHTTITNSHGGSIDRDVALMIPLDVDTHDDPRKIKGYVKDAITIWNRTITIKEPCVNISYVKDGKEWMHIDFPVYAKHNGNIYLARGRATSSNYEWEISDPKGLNEWLCNKINGNDQLRRVIRYLKKWKQEEYYNSTLDHEVPPSIGITLLACDCFEACYEDGVDDYLSVLEKTVQNIINKFVCVHDVDNKLIKADITRDLPTTPGTDVFKIMKDSSDSYGIKFYNKLSRALQNLKDACNEESEHDAGISIQKVFGEDFKVPVKQASTSSASSKKEHNFG